jgi:CHAD domain-containing protein
MQGALSRTHQRREVLAVPFRFKAREAVSQGAIRIVREQIARAVKELTDPQMDRHEAVHQVRKRLKKIRAVLRLVRFELGETYTSENAFYRDTGRSLSDVRDAEALVETADRLRERFPKEAQEAGLASVREALVERRAQVAEAEAGLQERIAQVVKELRAARRRAQRWPLKAEGFEALKHGLQRTYKRGRRALALAAREPTPENLHEWRKRAKYHWYHARLLRSLWQPFMDGYRKSIHTLADLLGHVHDLDVFRQTLLSEPQRFGTVEELRPLLRLVERHRAELVDEAHPLGRKAFAEEPASFCTRMESYWQAWQEEAGQ